MVRDVSKGREPTGEHCERCAHPFDDHALIAVAFIGSGHKHPFGGYTVCPVPTCKCVSTWQVDDPRYPYTLELERMTKRQLIATGWWKP